MALVDRANQEVGDEAKDKQGGHHVEDEGVGVSGGDVAHVNLVFAQVIDELRTQDAGDGPTGQQSAVDGADVVFAEEVAQVRGDCGEAAAVHAHDNGGDENEDGEAVEFARAHLGKQRVEQDAEAEEDHVGG